MDSFHIASISLEELEPESTRHKQCCNGKVDLSICQIHANTISRAFAKGHEVFLQMIVYFAVWIEPAVRNEGFRAREYRRIVVSQNCGHAYWRLCICMGQRLRGQSHMAGIGDSAMGKMRT